jgi:hypothetical protein
MPLHTGAYLYLSGTPFRAISTGEFIEEQIYNWTYSDEQAAKAAFEREQNEVRFDSAERKQARPKVKDPKVVKYIFEGCGSKENPDGIRKSVESLKAAGYNAEGLISEGTAHEFLTWRRCLRQMAQSLFK